MDEKKQDSAQGKPEAEAEKILAEARAEAEKIIADAKAKAAKDSRKTSGARVEPETQDPGEEPVEYTAPLLGPEKGQDIVVGVNGKIIRIKRGETVRIQRKFLEVLQHA